MFLRLQGAIYILLTAFFEIVTAARVNHTIDDTFGDSLTGDKPTYLPSAVWNDLNATCDTCVTQLDPNQAFNGTWTAAMYSPQLGSMAIELSFTGSAVYVFFILPNTAAPGGTPPTECNFTLDGQAAGKFIHVPTLNADNQYNALVFSRTTLSNVHHKLRISTAGVDHTVFVNFDYAIYTVDDTNAPIASSSVPAIVGGIVGAVVVLLALLFFFLLRCRRRNDKKANIEKTQTNPFDDANAPLIRNISYTTPYDGQFETDLKTVGTARSSYEGSRLSTLSNHSPQLDPNRTIMSTLPSGEILMISRDDPTLTGIPLTPVEPPNAHHDNSAEADRRRRRMEIDLQMQEVKEEMRALRLEMQERATRHSATASNPRDNPKARERIRMLQDQIEYLKIQQQSSWAGGLSDGPYTHA